jgi:CHASE3 domain sensor protein
MQPFYKRFSVITGFAALLLLLLANGLVIRQQLATQVENQSWVRHTAEVLLQLSDTESLLKDAETGQRGYLYTVIRNISRPTLSPLARSIRKSTSWRN